MSLLSELWKRHLKCGFFDQDLLLDSEFVQQTSTGKKLWPVRLGATKDFFVCLRYISDCYSCEEKAAKKKTSLISEKIEEDGPCILITTTLVKSLSIKKLQRRVLLCTFPGGAICYFKLRRVLGCGRLWSKWRSHVIKWVADRHDNTYSQVPSQAKLFHYNSLEAHLKVILYNTFTNDEDDSSAEKSTASEGDVGKTEKFQKSKSDSKTIQTLKATPVNSRTTCYKDKMKDLYGNITSFSKKDFAIDKKETSLKLLDLDKNSLKTKILKDMCSTTVLDGSVESNHEKLSAFDEKFEAKENFKKTNSIDETSVTSKENARCRIRDMIYEKLRDEDMRSTTVLDGSVESNHEKLSCFDEIFEAKEIFMKTDSTETSVTPKESARCHLRDMVYEKILNDIHRNNNNISNMEVINNTISDNLHLVNQSTKMEESHLRNTFSRKSRRRTTVVNRFGEGIAEGCIFELTMSRSDQLEGKGKPEIIVHETPSALSFETNPSTLSTEDPGLFDDFSPHKVISKALSKTNTWKRKSAPRDPERRIAEQIGYNQKPRNTDAENFNTPNKEITHKTLNFEIVNISACSEIFVGTPLWMKTDFQSISHLRRWNSEFKFGSAPCKQKAYLKKNESLPNLHELCSSYCDDSQLFYGNNKRDFKNSFSSDLKGNAFPHISFWVIDYVSSTPPTKRFYTSNAFCLLKNAHNVKKNVLKGFKDREINNKDSNDVEDNYSIFDTEKGESNSLSKMADCLKKAMKEIQDVRSMPQQRIWSKSTDRVQSLYHPEINSAEEKRPFIDKVDKLHPRDFSMQLSVINKKLFSEINVKEIYRLITQPHTVNELNCTHLIGFLMFFTRVSQLVLTVILGEQQIEDRVKIMAFFIEVASYCVEIKNFHSAASVLCGLTSLPLVRMKRTWRLFRTRYPELYYKFGMLLRTCFNEDPKFVREVLRKGLPFFGAYFRSILYNAESKKVPDVNVNAMNGKAKKWMEPPNLSDWIYANSGEEQCPSEEKFEEEALQKEKKSEGIIGWLKKVHGSMWNAMSNVGDKTAEIEALERRKESYLQTKADNFRKLSDFTATKEPKSDMWKQLKEDLAKFSSPDILEKVLFCESTWNILLKSAYNEPWENFLLSLQLEPPMIQANK